MKYRVYYTFEQEGEGKKKAKKGKSRNPEGSGSQEIKLEDLKNQENKNKIIEKLETFRKGFEDSELRELVSRVNSFISDISGVNIDVGDVSTKLLEINEKFEYFKRIYDENESEKALTLDLFGLSVAEGASMASGKSSESGDDSDGDFM